MFKLLKKWADAYFADEEAITLLILLLLGLLIVIYGGHIVGPIMASGIIAYLLQGMVLRLKKWMPYHIAVSITFAFFVSLFVLLIVLVIPLIVRQVTNLIAELPKIADKLQAFIASFQEQYPSVISSSYVENLVSVVAQEAGAWGQSIVTYSLSSLPNLFAMAIYSVLIPIMVFFFLKDKDQILGWIGSFLPEKRPLMNSIWGEMNVQVANYTRGKVVEVLIVGSATYITFLLMDLRYAALLGVLVGLSVIIPYIGAVAVTIPVAVIAYFQYGMTGDFGYVLLAYGIIQFLDGNVLVPFLFSEAVNMHPVAIIIAVLVFGGLWGVWGVFFAIPLATLIKALIQAWPNEINKEIPTEEKEEACE